MSLGGFDGDAWVALFTEDADIWRSVLGATGGPQRTSAHFCRIRRAQEDVEFTVERHWVSGDTVLAAGMRSLPQTWDGTTACGSPGS